MKKRKPEFESTEVLRDRLWAYVLTRAMPPFNGGSFAQYEEHNRLQDAAKAKIDGMSRMELLDCYQKRRK